jgi:CDP-diacylglycerol--serine O-phosphatidyltransferase
MNKTMFSMFNLPNLITSANMLCGIFSILLSIFGRIDLAPYPIFFGAIFDFFDGFTARIFNIKSELGKQLDSLADMITFGLAPGIMMMMLLVIIGFNQKVENIEFNSVNNFVESFFDTIKAANHDMIFFSWFSSILRFEAQNFIPLIALLIPFFSMFRLAKFNIDTRQNEGFIGLNTPANTLLMCTFPLILNQTYENESILFSLKNFVLQIEFIVPLIIFCSLLLVSEIPFFSLKFKHFKWKDNEIRYLFLIICLILIPITLFWSLGLIVILYLILSIVDNKFIKN